MKKLIVMMMLTAAIASCNKGDKIQSAFSEYVKTEKIPNYNGIVSIECADTMDFVKVPPVTYIKNQIDSVDTLLRSKVEKMTEFYGNLGYSEKRQLATEVARIGAECGELWVNNSRDNQALNEFKDAVEEISPYNEPLYFYHIIAKVGASDISFYGFSCGEEISFVKAENISDAIRKNEKLTQYENALMNVIRTNVAPCAMLIDDIDKLMSK